MTGSHPYERALIVLGGMLVVGALLAGLARRSFLSLAAVFVLAGFALGSGGLRVLDFDPRSGFVSGLATVALIVILFRDGLEVEAEMLRDAWHVPLRKLVLAMPITAAIVAVATHALSGLSWTQSFLVGALLAPTDPVLSSAVVTNPRVPRLIRHSLNLESGLNDGLALPAVLAFLAALETGRGHFVWWRFLLEDISIGFGVGIVVGGVGARLMPRTVALGAEVSPRQRALFGLGVAFLAYGIAALIPHGNGLIAVFVGAITLGILRPDIRDAFDSRMPELVELVKLGIFVVFGSLLSLDGLFGLGHGLAAVGIVLVTLLIARPAAVLASLARTATDLPTRLFMGWFGPKGVATMTFSLLVLSAGVSDGRRIFDIAALAVLVSIIAHSLSDHAGAAWIARRADRGPQATPPAG